MNNTANSSPQSCNNFLDQLDQWLAGELPPAQSLFMQGHEDSCPACQLEARLARNIDSITHALPERESAALARTDTDPSSAASPAGSRQGAHHPAAPILALGRRLLHTWSQPLVFAPALGLLLVVLVLLQSRLAQQASEAQTLTINGVTYTQAEIVQAAEDLELALRYLDKYGSYPARVVQTELQQSRLPLPAANEDDNPPSI